MAAIVAVPLRIILSSPDLLRQVAANDLLNLLFQVGFYFVVINVFLFIFNLIPIPPLDGWKVLTGLVPSPTAWRLRQIEQQYAMIIPVVFLAVIFVGGARILTPISDFLLTLLLGLP
jgi:Zn-dependent protease